MPLLRLPFHGEKIYIPSSCHVYRGCDDVQGGLATIDRITYNHNLPQDHHNYIMVGFVGIPVAMYNYKHLINEQEELKTEYKDLLAKPEPDDRKEFNTDDDWVEIVEPPTYLKAVYLKNKFGDNAIDVVNEVLEVISPEDNTMCLEIQFWKDIKSILGH